MAVRVIEIIKDTEKQAPKLRAIVQHNGEEVLKVNHSGNFIIRINLPLLIELDNIRLYLKRLKHTTSLGPISEVLFYLAKFSISNGQNGFQFEKRWPNFFQDLASAFPKTC